jgi:hypothetical protein
MIGAISMLTVSAYAETNIAGNYTCTRIDASKSSTTYPLIVKSAGDGFGFEWDNASGYPQLYGTGIMHSKLNNAVAVSYWDAKDANNYGIELFDIKSDGSLSGVWAQQSTNQTGTDTCVKSK